jgi:hypothetical protein
MQVQVSPQKGMTGQLRLRYPATVMVADPMQRSDRASDKLQAALVRIWDEPERDFPRAYIEACARWFAGLSERERGLAAYAVWAYRGGEEARAAEIAAALPPAPRVPVLWTGG